MALKSSAISLFLFLSILLAMAGHALASRAGPTKNNEEDKKQPEWFIEPDGSVIIPGIGRILVPMPGHSTYHRHSATYAPNPNYGSTGGNYGGNGGNYGGSGDNSGSTHIPGGDDTFVPNPEYGVPAPSTP